MNTRKVTTALLSALAAGMIFMTPTYAQDGIYDEPFINVEEDLIFLDSPEEVELCEDDRYDDLDLLAQIVVAEAEGESEKGKRLVIDTILNRVDSDQFPDTVREVIYQKNQFTCVSNGRLSRVEVTDDIYELIEEEIDNRTCSHCVFFNSIGYTKYGKALFREGNHYFSSL